MIEPTVATVAATVAMVDVHTVYEAARMAGYALWPVLGLGGAWAVVSTVNSFVQLKRRVERAKQLEQPGLEYVDVSKISNLDGTSS